MSPSFPLLDQSHGEPFSPSSLRDVSSPSNFFDSSLWDASTGQVFSEYTEHERRAWSVDFSQIDPKKLASGSDDSSVKLWSINEVSSGRCSTLMIFIYIHNSRFRTEDGLLEKYKKTKNKKTLK
ncbi:hypothetical protein GIB67_034896 [Kingdonia uniflora]|uniref:Uncharacterized protein n=1 Tax=Kingdonia uniflora TaxID=39325 RepID=A0A7J7KVZ3_9MAGN|nr:hypothetical protein GIB67_034896 [Kingdonia uniflora]